MYKEEELICLFITRYHLNFLGFLSVLYGLINPRGQYRASFSNTGGSPKPRKRAPCQKKLKKHGVNCLFFLSSLFSVTPSVTLSLGRMVNPQDLEEGDDIYFSCTIKANPPAYKLTWWHNVSRVQSKHRLQGLCFSLPICFRWIPPCSKAQGKLLGQIREWRLCEFGLWKTFWAYCPDETESRQ